MFKILIIANSSNVFGRELKDELIDKNYDVYLLDFESLILYDSINKIEKYNKKFLKYNNIPKISMLFRMMIIREILNDNNFDIVNIHFSRWFYLIILNTLSKAKLVITFYGSDFYRTTDKIKDVQKILYKKADAITFTNPLTKKSFLKYYDDYKDKIYVCRFGIKTLDFIDKNRDKNTVEIKKYLGYSCDKIIVTCGYNSTKAQQHEEIIKCIKNLDVNYKRMCQFIFPLTYGDNIHKTRVKDRLNSVDFDYIILEDFLYEDDNAYIKFVSDIMINALQTDSFSGSMQEFLYAQNIVITGSWLPYEIFDKKKIKYYKIDSIDELGNKLVDIIDNIENIKTNLVNNKDIIYKLSSWKNNIENWENVLKLELNDLHK